MHDTDIDRREFLKKSAVAPVGLAGVLAQDEPSAARTARRVVLDYPERLEGGPRQKILLMTDRDEEDPDVSEVAGCAFADWPPTDVGVWEGIIVDWESAAGDLRSMFSGARPVVRANRLIELDTIYVDEQDSPVPLGTPFVANRVEECPGEWIGLNATQIPGVEIRTGPGVSTDE